MGLAYAGPASINDSLTGYTGENADGSPNPLGSTENAATVAQLLANGLEPQVIWGGGDGIADPGAYGSWEEVLFDTTGAAFGTGRASDDGRNLIRTIEDDYKTVSFDAYITVVDMNADDTNVFLGLGAGSRGTWAVPEIDWDNVGTGTDGVFVEVLDDSFTAWITDNGDFGGWDGRVGDAGPGAGTHRFKMSYDADAQTAVFSYDANYDGVFVEDLALPAVDVSGLFTEGDPTKVYFGTDDGALLKDFEIVADPIAQNPSPWNGEPLVDKNAVTLSWYPPDANTPDEYTLYLRADDPNFADLPNLVNGVSVTPAEIDPTTYGAGTLEFETTYYWRVDTRIAADWYEGDVWSFTTAPAIPVIITDPVSQTVVAGVTVEFTVVAQNGDTYKWYHDGDEVIGATTDTLTVADVDTSDEGEYYCEVSNATEEIVPSEIAYLWTERLMAHWTFDDTLTDVVDLWEGIYTDPNEFNTPPTAVYDANSISGKSLSLAGDDLYVKITDSVDWFNFFTNGFTVVAWVKSDTADSGYHTVVSKSVVGLATGFGLSYHYAQAAVAVRGVSGEAWSPAVESATWHLFVGRYDTQAQTLTVFVDGVLAGTVKNASASVAATAAPLIIGAETPDGGASYGGLVDELKIYSYPVDAYEIAHMYTDVMTDQTVCVDQVGLQYDYNGDCRITLPDFAMFAATWANCNIVPDCD